MDKRPIIKKRGGVMMMLVIVLVRSRNYGRSGNRKTQVKRSIWTQRKKQGMFTRPHVKQKGKDLETYSRRR